MVKPTEFKLIYEQDIQDCIDFIRENGEGKTISITKISSKRSVAQNRLQRKWHLEAANQLNDETAEEKRAYCKLHFGVPILIYELEEFAEKYRRIIKPLDYEQKLELMSEPFDFPVTRLMSADQKKRYLDAIYQHYRGLGVVLTEPEERKI